MESLACHRYRKLASLALDEESSQLDALALARHLGECAACRAFTTTVEAFTDDLRRSPREDYEVGWTQPPRHRRVDELIRRSAVGIAVASVAGFAMFLGAALESFDSGNQVPRSLPALVIDTSGADTARETQRFLRALRDARLARTVGGPERVPEGPGMRLG